MKKIEFWKAVSLYSSIICGLMLVILMFFRKYIELFLIPFIYIGIVILLISVFSELFALFLKKKRNMIKRNWKRFSYFDKGLAAFFILNLFLDVINDKILDSLIPFEIIGYLFWLSLGLYLGFQLCKFEYKRSLKSIEKKEPQNKQDSSIEKRFGNTTGTN